jgi:DNA-directed RNA polymerase specialized sigma24 family protein
MRRSIASANGYRSDWYYPDRDKLRHMSLATALDNIAAELLRHFATHTFPPHFPRLIFQDFEECSQDVFICYHKKKPTLDFLRDVETLDTFIDMTHGFRRMGKWLSLAFRHTCLAKCTRYKRMVLVPPSDLSLRVAARESVDDDALIMALRDVIDGMDPHERDIITEHHFHAIALEHLADTFNCSYTAMSTRLYRARASIARELRERHGALFKQ